MMPVELLAAIAAPTIAGFFSLALFIGKKNGHAIDEGFRKLQGTVELVTKKVDDVDDKVDKLKINVAENYVTKIELNESLANEEIWHKKTDEEIYFMREEMREARKGALEHTEKLRNDISEIKEMQWKTRMGILDLVDRKIRGRPGHNFEGDLYDEEEG